MNKKIQSSFDLSKSLSNFKEKVTKLLEIKNLSEWSAQTFKDREEEIRNTALTLAGECVAVFLNKLSHSQEALDTAISQTRSWSNQKIRTSSIPITNDGTYSGYEYFLNILEMYLVSLGISQAKQVLFIADGAEWIWKHIPPLLKKVKCPHATYQLLDFYHAVSPEARFC